MGHLLEAIKKLDQQRAAARPKPESRGPLTEQAGRIWRFDQAHHGRIDEPHVAAARHSAEPGRATVEEPAVAAWRTIEIAPADASQSAPEKVPAAATVTVLGGVLDIAPGLTAPAAVFTTVDEWPSASAGQPSVADVAWRFAAPVIPIDYHNLAACILRQAAGSQRPQSLLLTAVSSAALERVSRAALAAVLSTQGKVLWIDAQNAQPTPAAVGPAQGSRPGWHELWARKASWDEIITPTSLPGVSFVGCGERALGNIGQDFAGQLFEPLRSVFSIVLVTGGLVEDSGSLAPLCDVTGLVVPIGQVTRQQMGRALATLDAAGGRSPLVIAVEPRRA